MRSFQSEKEFPKILSNIPDLNEHSRQQYNSSSADFIKSLIKMKSGEHNRQMLQLKRFSMASDFGGPLPQDSKTTVIQQSVGSNAHQAYESPGLHQHLITVGRQTQIQLRENQQNVRNLQQQAQPITRQNKSRQRLMAEHNINLVNQQHSGMEGDAAKTQSQQVLTQEVTILSSHAVVANEPEVITPSLSRKRLNDEKEKDIYRCGILEVKDELTEFRQETDDNTHESNVNDKNSEGIGAEKKLMFLQRDTSVSQKDQRPNMAELRMLVGDTDMSDQTSSPLLNMRKSDSFASTLLVNNNPQFRAGNSSGAVATRQISKVEPIGENQMSELLMEDSTDNFLMIGRAHSLPQAALMQHADEVVSGTGIIQNKQGEVRQFLDSCHKHNESRDSLQNQLVIIESNEFVETENIVRQDWSQNQDGSLEQPEEEGKPSNQDQNMFVEYQGSSSRMTQKSDETKLMPGGRLTNVQSSLNGDQRTLTENNSQQTMKDIVISHSKGQQVFIDKQPAHKEKQKQLQEQQQQLKLKKELEYQKAYFDADVLPLQTHVKQRPSQVSNWLQKSKNLQSFTSKLPMSAATNGVNNSSSLQSVREQGKKFLSRASSNANQSKAVQVTTIPVISKLSQQRRNIQSQADQQRVVLLSNTNGTCYSFRSAAVSQTAPSSDKALSGSYSHRWQSRQASLGGQPGQDPFLQPTQVYRNQKFSNTKSNAWSYQKRSSSLGNGFESTISREVQSKFCNEYRRSLINKQVQSTYQAPQALAIECSDLTDRVDLMRALLNNSSDEESDHWAPPFYASTAMLQQDSIHEDSAKAQQSNEKVQADEIQSQQLKSKKFKPLTQKVYKMDMREQQLSTNRPPPDDIATESPSRRSDCSKKVQQITTLKQTSHNTSTKHNDESFQIVVLRNNLPEVPLPNHTESVRFHSQAQSTLVSMPKMSEPDQNQPQSQAAKTQLNTSIIKSEKSEVKRPEYNNNTLAMIKIGTKQERQQHRYVPSITARQSKRMSNNVALKPLVSKNVNDLAMLCMIDDQQENARNGSVSSQTFSLLEDTARNGVEQSQRTTKRSAAEVAPWTEGNRHLNFSQRYRHNQVNVSRATYGLQTSQLKDFNSKMIQATDFARCQQAHLARKGLKSQEPVKLVCYRSQTSGIIDNRRKVPVSRGAQRQQHHWAKLDETRDLSDLQISQRSIQYVDLVQQKNLQFHKMSESDPPGNNGSEEKTMNKSQEDQLQASQYPFDVPENHPTIVQGLRTNANNLQEDYEQTKKEKRLQKKRDNRLGRLKSSRVIQPSVEMKGNIATKNLFDEQSRVTKYLLQLQQNPKQGLSQIPVQKSENEDDTTRVKILDASHLPFMQKDLQEKYTFRKGSKTKRRNSDIYVPKNEIINISSQEDSEEDGDVTKKLKSHQITLIFTQGNEKDSVTGANEEKGDNIDLSELPLLYKDNELCRMDTTQTAVRNSYNKIQSGIGQSQNNSMVKQEETNEAILTFVDHNIIRMQKQDMPQQMSTYSDAESLLKEEHAQASAKLMRFEAAIPQCEKPKYKMKTKVKTGSGRSSTTHTALIPLPVVSQGARVKNLSQPRMTEEFDSESQKSISNSVNKVKMAHKYSFQKQNVPLWKPVETLPMNHRPKLNSQGKAKNEVSYFEKQHPMLVPNDQAIAQVNKDLSLGMFCTTSYDSSEGLIKHKKGSKKQVKTKSNKRQRESRGQLI